MKQTERLMHFRPVSWLPSAKPIVQICPARSGASSETSWKLSPKSLVSSICSSHHESWVLWVLSILTFHYGIFTIKSFIRSFIMDPNYERVEQKNVTVLVTFVRQRTRLHCNREGEGFSCFIVIKFPGCKNATDASNVGFCLEATVNMLKNYKNS